MQSLPLVALAAFVLTGTAPAAATRVMNTTYTFGSAGSSLASTKEDLKDLTLSRRTPQLVEFNDSEDRMSPAEVVEDAIIKIAESAEFAPKKDLSALVNERTVADVKAYEEELEKLAAAKRRAGELKSVPVTAETGALKDVDVVKRAGRKDRVITTYGADGSWKKSRGAHPDYTLSEDAKMQVAAANEDRNKQAVFYVEGAVVNEHSLRREMVEDGLKVAPEKYMNPHFGRKKQIYNEQRYRMLGCGVVMDPATKKIVLISRTDPHKPEWILAKGGWDKGETIFECAKREVTEEAGVRVEEEVKEAGAAEVAEADEEVIAAAKAAAEAEVPEPLVRTVVMEEDGMETMGFVYHVFKLDALEFYDQWAESKRQRIMVTVDDAIHLLKDRHPYMAAMVYDVLLRDEELKKLKELREPKLANAVNDQKVF